MLLLAALEKWSTLFLDFLPILPNDKGGSMVGNAIAKCGVSRSELFITTKVNFKSYDNTRTTVENSMKKLQTEYLDMVLLHWPFGNVYGAWHDLEKLYEEGKIRAIGVSNFEPDRLIDLISFNKVKPVINQIETHIYCQRHIEHEWEDKYGVAHQAYAPLGQGRANDMFKEEAIKRVADKYGKTPARVSLRFLLQNNVVIIPKSVHESRMKKADRGNVFCGLRFLCFSEVYYSRCTIRWMP